MDRVVPGVHGALSLIPSATQTGCGGVHCNLRQRRYRRGGGVKDSRLSLATDTVSSGSHDIQSVNKQRLNKRECLKFAFMAGGGINIKVFEDCSSEVMRSATFLST